MPSQTNHNAQTNRQPIYGPHKHITMHRPTDNQSMALTNISQCTDHQSMALTKITGQADA